MLMLVVMIMTNEKTLLHSLVCCRVQVFNSRCLHLLYQLCGNLWGQFMIVFIMRHNTIQFNTCSVNIYRAFSQRSNALLLITPNYFIRKRFKTIKLYVIHTKKKNNNSLLSLENGNVPFKSFWSYTFRQDKLDFIWSSHFPAWCSSRIALRTVIKFP